MTKWAKKPKFEELLEEANDPKYVEALENAKTDEDFIKLITWESPYMDKYLIWFIKKQARDLVKYHKMYEGIDVTFEDMVRDVLKAMGKEGLFDGIE